MSSETVHERITQNKGKKMLRGEKKTRGQLRSRAGFTWLLLVGICWGCGPEPDSEAATRLLDEARQESDSANFELARKHLKQAAPLTTAKSELRAEIEYELEYRLVLKEAMRQLNEQDTEGFSATLADLEDWVEEHPDHIREAREVDELRSSGSHLGQALSAQFQSYLKEVEMILKVAHAEEGYPQDEEALAALLRNSRVGSNLDLISYEWIDDDAYEAIFEDPASGQRGRLAPKTQRSSGAGGSNPTLDDLLNAIHKGDADSARNLIASGLDLYQTVDGETPLGMALWRGQWETSLELLWAGADPNLAGPYFKDRTPLMIAAGKFPPTEIFSALVDQGANVDAQDKKGLTALMQAARKGSASVVRALLELGADPEIEDNRGNTAANHARAINQGTAISEMLRQAIEGPEDYEEKYWEEEEETLPPWEQEDSEEDW
ncbi:MAG: ankyrin repeat domain-containing protein [Deltaproteobacteria bacterium]|nr:ankyrin repeat domain-containing protein [Deltaproteobacteria bacterium]